jgi:hypothetical protein
MILTIWPSPNKRGQKKHLPATSTLLFNISGSKAREHRGRILRRNLDKSLKSFPPCYSQSPLLTDIPPPPPLSKSGLKLVHNVNNVYGNLKSDQDYAQKTQRHSTFMSTAPGCAHAQKHSLFCAQWLIVLTEENINEENVDEDIEKVEELDQVQPHSPVVVAVQVVPQIPTCTSFC